MLVQCQCDMSRTASVPLPVRWTQMASGGGVVVTLTNKAMLWVERTGLTWLISAALCLWARRGRFPPIRLRPPRPPRAIITQMHFRDALMFRKRSRIMTDVLRLTYWLSSIGHCCAHNGVPHASECRGTHSGFFFLLSLYYKTSSFFCHWSQITTDILWLTDPWVEYTVLLTRSYVFFCCTYLWVNAWKEKTLL